MVFQAVRVWQRASKKQQHTPVKVGMLPFVPYLGYIPHIVDEADPVFAIVLIHIITKIMYFAHLTITSCRKHHTR